MRTPPLAFALLSLAGCAVVNGDGDVVSQTRDMSGFTAVTTSGNVDLDVTGGTEDWSVVLTCDRNLLPHIETVLDGDELDVRVERGVWLRPSGTCEATLGLPAVRRLASSGSGDITAVEVGAVARLHTSGSGDLFIADIDSPDVDISSSGSGDIRAAGRADAARLETSGSGDIHARDLRVGRADLHASGSGGISVTAEGRVDAQTSGSGNLHIYGDPTSVDARTSGSGDIHIHGDPGSLSMHSSGSGDVIVH